MVEVMETMVTSFKRSCAHPQPCRRPLLTHASSRDAWTLIGKSGSVSCGVTAPFSWVMVHKVLLCPPRVYFPVLCKFWQLYNVVNGNLLQKGLCHTQVCCTQSLCPRGSPLLTRTSTADTQTQLHLGLCGSLGPSAHKVCLNPEHLWQELGLILNMNSPLLPSCWGFSFALECGLSPHSCSRAYHLTGVSLTLDMGYLFTAAPAKRSHCS